MGTPLAIMTNTGSLSAQKSLMRTSRAMQSSISHLSSGLRVNSASEDPAGLAVAENMRAQLRGFQMALRNANDGVAIMQVAESGYQTLSDIMVRMREIAVQSSNDSISNTERGFLNTEYEALIDEMDRISDSVEYNGIQLLDGSAATLTFQVGTRGTVNDEITFLTEDLDAAAFAIEITDEDVATQTASQTAITAIDTALESLNTSRATLGTSISRINMAIDHLGNTVESYGAAVGNIRDADMAKESADFSKNQVLQQAAVAMLAQANALPNLALRLLS